VYGCPGGSLGALIDRHQTGVWHLVENVRQTNPEERRALAELRAGSVDVAVDWMAANRRIVTAADRTDTLAATVTGWNEDINQAKDTIMLAWRRKNVDALNTLGRQAFADLGRLTGPELTAPGGRAFQARDRIVTLAPDNRGGIVTSERGTVETVHGDTMTVRMADGRMQPFAGETLAKDRLAHGYAITVHRSQGATVDTAHRLEDGGGRELAYVSAGRARQRTTVYAVADDLNQAVNDLKRDWHQQRRKRWAIDSGTPATTPEQVEADLNVAPALRNALRHARLAAERDAITKAIPADVTNDLHRTGLELARHRRDLTDLDTGGGRWEGTEIGESARAVLYARDSKRHAERMVGTARGGTRRNWTRQAKQLAETVADATQQFEEIADPARQTLRTTIASLEDDHTNLQHHAHTRTIWLDIHPEIGRRVAHLNTELHILDRALQLERNTLDGVQPEFPDLVIRPASRSISGPGLGL